MSIGKRLFAFMYHNFLSSQGHIDLSDDFTREVRVPLLAKAQGDVLEIGAGDGANLPYYPDGVSLTLLDPNPYLLRHAPEVAARRGFEVETELAYAEALPFPDAHFDTVVTTHVLCSVRDQARALAEIRRVIRPGGLFLFLEHVAARPETFTYRVQHVINPAWKLVGDGCHLTRNTATAIQDAGFSRVELRAFEADGLGIVSPHIVGQAVR